MGCCSIFSKIVLVTINTIFWLASALMLAFGIAGKANPDAVQAIFNFLIPADQRSNLQGMGVNLTEIVVSNSIFMIIVGVVGLVIATIGFVGACCTVRWLLVTYAILLIILLLGEIALIIFAAVYSNSFKQVFQQAMYQSITDEFDADIQVNASGFPTLPTSLASLSWASVQLESKCCGAYNYTDYQQASKWLNKTYLSGVPQSIPLSCCKQAGNSSSNAYSFVNVGLCEIGNSQYINSQNCYDSVESFINQFKGIAIGIAAGIAGLELILIVMAFVLCARGSNEKDGYV